MPEDSSQYLRVERAESPELHDETSHLWAVSYADFLMVLLSFFILFFSVTPEAKRTTVDAIVQTTDKLASSADSPKAPAPPKAADDATPDLGVTVTNLSDLETRLKGFHIETTKAEQQVVFLFPDNMYASGQIGLPADKLTHVREVLRKIHPFREKIELVFVGHTDSLPYRHARGKILQDNFDLSVLRATKALQLAVRMGFDPEQVSAQGSANTERSSRTLSLVLRIRSEESKFGTPPEAGRVPSSSNGK